MLAAHSPVKAPVVGSFRYAEVSRGVRLGDLRPDFSADLEVTYPNRPATDAQAALTSTLSRAT